MNRIIALLLAVLLIGPAHAQQLNALPQAATPLSGSELVYVVQGGVSKQTTASYLGSVVTWPLTGEALISSGGNTPTGVAPINGECLGGAGGVWTTVSCGGLSGVAANDIVISQGSSSPTGLAPVNGACVQGAGGVWTTGSCGGAIELLDSNGNTVTSVSSVTLGPGFLLSGSGGTAYQNLNQPDRTVTSCSGVTCTITANDMGGQVNFNGASLTATIPAISTASFTGSISTTTLTVSGVTGTIHIGQLVQGTNVTPGTVITAGSGTSWTVSHSQTVSGEAMTSAILGAGQSFTIMNYNSTALQLASTPAINGFPGGATGTVPQYGGIGCISNGATLDCLGFGVQPNQAFTNAAQTWTGVQTWGESLIAPNIQSGTTYTLQASDCGGTIISNNASAVTITTLATLPVGCAIVVEQKGAGQVTIFPGSGATETSASSYTKTRTQYAVIGLFVDANVGGSAANFNISGDGA